MARMVSALACLFCTGNKLCRPSSLSLLSLILDASLIYSYLTPKGVSCFQRKSYSFVEICRTRSSSSSSTGGSVPAIGSSRGRINSAILTFAQSTQQHQQLIISAEEEIYTDGIDDIINDSTINYCRQLDETLINLQSYLPLILQSTAVPDTDARPATSSSSNNFITNIYSSKNFTLVGPRNEILASGIDELATLSSILVAATAAANGFRNVLLSTTSFSTQQQKQQLDIPILDCQIILLVDAAAASAADTSFSTTLLSATNTAKLITVPSPTIYVKWSTEIPAITTATSIWTDDASNNRNLKIQGLSEIILDETDGRITLLRLLDVTVNNRTVIAIGEALAALRQMTLPLVMKQQQQQQNQQQSFFTDLVRDVLQIAIAESNNNYSNKTGTSSSATSAPIYVTAVKNISNYLLSGITLSSTKNLIIPIDTYCSSATATTTPIPGSKGWKKFIQSRDAILEFCHTALPQLAYYNTDAGNNFNFVDDDETTAKLYPFFNVNATLFGLDGKEILHDRPSVLKLYKNLADLRYSTLGDFTIKTLKANYLGESYLTVQWQTTWPISVEGTDRFIFNTNGQVERIEQIKWIVQGSPMKDAEWVRAFVRAVMEIFNVGSGATTTSSSSAKIDSEKIFSDLLKRAIGVAGSTIRTPSRGLPQVKEGAIERKLKYDDDVKYSTRELSDEAAISLCQIVRALHREIPLQLEMLSKKDDRPTTAAPAARFLAGNVELRGLLNELIAGDRVRYKQVFATALASLRAATQTGWIDVELISPITIEIKRDSNLKIKVSLGVKFPKLPTTITQPLRILPSLASSPNMISQESMKVDVLFLFQINDAGKISQIRIIETRINGMLTPSDVVSKWIMDANAEGNSDDGISAPLRAVMSNALSWATRSKGSGDV